MFDSRQGRTLLMGILLFNTIWMSWNAILAFVSVFFGWKALHSKTIQQKLLYLFLWLLFVPNTIYILTDFYHLIQQLPWINNLMKPLLIFQYLVFIPLGILSFVLSLGLFEKTLKKIAARYKYFSSKKFMIERIIIAINFLIAFGVILGRIHRLNSWEVFIDPAQVLRDTLETIASIQLMTYVLLFGFLSYVLYRLMKKIFFEAGVGERT